MTLTSVAYKTNEEPGIKYDMTVFTLGEHYTVEREIVVFESGYRWVRYDVRVDRRDAEESFIPEIFCKCNSETGYKPVFTIQMTAYGAKNADEIQKVIAGYQEAVEAVKILEKNFG